MNVPKKIRSMPWPEVWKHKGNQTVAITLAWPVVDYEKLLVATFRRNRDGDGREIAAPDFRVVCSKKRNRAALVYRDGHRPKRSDTLHTAAGKMGVGIATCYPEITLKDEAALGKWLGCRETVNHFMREFAAWVKNAIEAEDLERRAARGELEDGDYTLCPEELPEGLEDYIRREVLPHDRVLIYRKGNTVGRCYMCGRMVRAHGRRFTQNNVVTCPNCGEAVVAYLGTSERYAVDYVQDIIAMQRGRDGATLFLRQWHLCRDETAKWEDIPAQLDEVTRYAIRGERVAKWQIEKKENWYMNTYRYRLDSWERVRNVTEVYDGEYCFFTPENWRDILRGTSVEYCDLDGYLRDKMERQKNHDTRANVVRFLMDWARYPAVEKLWKAGYTELIHARLAGAWKRHKTTVDWKAPTIQGAVRFPLRLLRGREPGEWDYNAVTRMATLWNMVEAGGIREPEAMELFRSGVEIQNIRDALGHATVHKVLKYVEKCIAAEEAERAKAAAEGRYYCRRRITAPETYRDYLADCINLHLDLDDREILFPPDLEAAHRRTTAQIQYYKNREAWEKFTARAKKLAGMTWERDGLLIRPAATPGELTEEGEALHHCVGGYADRMARGETTILLIRRETAPETPFYTLEWRDGEVIQCRTEHNASYTADDTVRAFVEAWVERMTKKNKKRGKAASAA